MASIASESLFWAAALACVVAQLAILRAVVGASPDEATQGHPAAADPRRTPPAKRRGRAVEATWALLPGVALALVLFWTWHAVHPAHPAPSQTNSQSLIAPATHA